MAKKEMFYANADKYRRAEHDVANGKYKTIKEAYEVLGGLIQKGNGYMPV
jgi:hypothetical protein